MATNGKEMTALFNGLADIENEFADVELDALRRKEHHLKPLYVKRDVLLRKVPEFWPQVFLNAPEEIQQLYSPADMGILSVITSFNVERYQVKSETEGEPRSLRFTFEFDENEYFENKKLVKEFEYKEKEDGPGNLISKPVSIQWKSKNDVTNGLLDAAIELERAEKAIGKDIESEEREALWQYEKLRAKIEEAEEETSDELSFFNWFGFRGAVGKPKSKPASAPATNGDKKEEDDDDEEDSDDDDDFDDGTLDVEIFPAGEEVAICLADELWPSVMDYFMRAQEEGDEDDFGGFGEDDGDIVDIDVDDEEEDVPDLVDEEESRPKKRQRSG